MKRIHTQGEWKVKTTEETQHQTLFVYSPVFGAICQIPHRFKAIQEHESNAQLIVAAPKMLEILTRMNDLLQQHQKQDSKILAGYTLAANLGEEATNILNDCTKIFSTLNP